MNCEYLLHTYSELSARHCLERARKRGEIHKTMFYCPLADHWHVLDSTFDEWVNAR